VLWPGTCVVHERFSERELVRLRERHPAAKLAAHPECPEAILAMADHIGSTSSLIKYVTESPDTEFIIATEPHIIHQMERRVPGKRFIPAPGMDESCSCNNCPFMALNTMEKLYLCLANMVPRIEIAEDLRRAALKPLVRMLEMSPPAAGAPARSSPEAELSAEAARRGVA
jgi:quinolinate synthase